MQKVYLLLRNNRQTGPFTIGELLQQQLKPTDMIWVEGKSSAWAYLSEIELLPSAEHTSAGTPAKDQIEERAEELRLQALSYHPPRRKPVLVDEWEEPAEEKKEDEIVLMDHRNDKPSIIGELMMTGLIIALFAGGIYGSKTLFQSQKTAPVTAGKIISNDQHSAAQALPVHESETTVRPGTDSLSLPGATVSDSTTLHPAAPAHTASRKKDSKKDSLTIAPAAVMHANDQGSTLPETTASTPSSGSTSGNLDSQSRQDAPVSIEQHEPEKKKGLGAALKGLFKKKKKESHNPSEEADSTQHN